MADVVPLPLNERPPLAAGLALHRNCCWGEFLIATCLGDARNLGVIGPYQTLAEAMEIA
jgi:hypothetical protein